MKEGVGITVRQRKRELYHDKETDDSLKISGAGMEELKELVEGCGFSDVEIKSVPELGIVPKDNIRGEICDYEPWFVLTGRKG